MTLGAGDNVSGSVSLSNGATLDALIELALTNVSLEKIKHFHVYTKFRGYNRVIY